MREFNRIPSALRQDEDIHIPNFEKPQIPQSSSYSFLQVEDRTEWVIGDGLGVIWINQGEKWDILLEGFRKATPPGTTSVI